MNAYDLPTSLRIGEVDFPINAGWRNMIDIFMEIRNPQHNQSTKTAIMLCKLFPNWKDIPSELIPEAIEKARDFMDCGIKNEERKKPRSVDWEQDAPLIIPAVNKVYGGTDIRLHPDIHWWTFFGWYMSITDSLFSTVLHIRQKKIKGKKLEKWEEEFYRENRKMVDFTEPETDEIRIEKENLLKWL